MNDQVLDEEPSIQGKWHDFKIYLDDNMRQQTIQDALNPTGTILTPRDIDGNFTAGDFAGAVSPRTEWAYSQLSRSNGMKKLQPAVMQIELQIPEGISYVDLSLCASILNGISIWTLTNCFNTAFLSIRTWNVKYVELL